MAPGNYYKEFFKSPAHAWTALLTVGVGLATANPVGMIVGGAAYVLAWIYFPDSKAFKARIDKLMQARELQKATLSASKRAETVEEIARKLDRAGFERFQEFQKLAKELESAIGSKASSTFYPVESLTQNIHEIESTYLRLLGQNARLIRFLEREQKSDLERAIRDLEAEIQELSDEIEKMEREDPYAEPLSARKRTLELQQTRLETLRERRKRIATAAANLDLANADLDRIDEQLKLLLADALSRIESNAFTSRVDEGMRQLTHTNQWLTELEQE